jgi:hypothetical protein
MNIRKSVSYNKETERWELVNKEGRVIVKSKDPCTLCKIVKFCDFDKDNCKCSLLS